MVHYGIFRLLIFKLVLFEERRVVFFLLRFFLCASIGVYALLFKVSDALLLSHDIRVGQSLRDLGAFSGFVLCDFREAGLSPCTVDVALVTSSHL